jgi:eukaryotic-like serine/threonine-protein kinase
LALTPGTRLGVYEVTAQIGEGGMGQVYRATDTKLKRQVAIKILPPALAADHDRLARFQREAEVLASLNHPNIAAIHGLEESGGMTALIMELVEGDDLSQRIARGAIPVDEALPIAKQIAEALEAAHEQGIIHRDLKPANIKVRDDGTVKVLDFGLAKAMDPVGSAPNMSQSPTITTPAMTHAGMILGTAAYMSPEQAKGRAVDKRSDIWAFGCVLFEMLTGKRAFKGEDVSEVLASILAREPDWSTFPAAVPPAIRALLRRCLEKDRRKRVADISTALFALDEAPSLSAPVGTVSVAPLPRRPRWRRVAALTAGALVVAVVVGTAVWYATRPADTMPPRVSRLQAQSSGTASVTINGNDRDLAITPDGSRVVYIGNTGTQIFVRALDALEPVAVFTGAPRGPFVSPDGQWIGFVDSGNTLRKVALTGGPAVTLTTLDGLPRGATWGPDDTIIVATDTLASGLQRVAAAGGSTTVLTRPNRAQGEGGFFWPELLPGGRAVLFTITALTGGLDAAQVAVLDLQTGTRRILVRGGSHASYVPSGLGSPKRAERGGGHLVYAAAGTLRAVPFDVATLETRGTPVPVVPAVVTTSFGASDAVVAGDGTLAYVSGGGLRGANAPRTLVWVDRQGRETPIPAPPRAYTIPRLSPDGTRVAVGAEDQERDLWLWDLARATLTRLTFEPESDSSPVWTPDGRRLLLSSNRDGQTALYVQAADGTGSATRVTEDAQRPQNATAITADGTRVILYELTPTRGRDLRLLTLTPTPRVEPLLETRFEELNGGVSPDGRWLVYQSNSAGRFEIYVRPFPNVGDGQWQVSSAGGVQPLWARSGRELFYLAPDGTLMTVPVESHDTTWSAGTPTKLFTPSYLTGGISRGYDVSPDGQRFLMIKEGGSSGQSAAPPQIVVVQHWTEELKARVPTK